MNYPEVPSNLVLCLCVPSVTNALKQKYVRVAKLLPVCTDLGPLTHWLSTYCNQRGDEVSCHSAHTVVSAVRSANKLCPSTPRSHKHVGADILSHLLEIKGVNKKTRRIWHYNPWRTKGQFWSQQLYQRANMSDSIIFFLLLGREASCQIHDLEIWITNSTTVNMGKCFCGNEGGSGNQEWGCYWYEQQSTLLAHVFHIWALWGSFCTKCIKST